MIKYSLKNCFSIILYMCDRVKVGHLDYYYIDAVYYYCIIISTAVKRTYKIYLL